jgi:hypothetical protein
MKRCQLLKVMHLRFYSPITRRIWTLEITALLALPCPFPARLVINELSDKISYSVSTTANLKLTIYPNRFLRQTIQSRVLTPTILPTLLLAVRTSLFPMNARAPPASSNPDLALPVSRLSWRYNNNSNNEQVSGVEMGSGSGLVDADTAKSSGSVSPLAETPQQRQRPSEAEIAAIKRQCAADILSLIPRRIARAFFCITAEDIAAETNRRLESQKKRETDLEPALSSATATQNSDDVEESLLLSAIENDILDPFADEYCNKHLVFSIIETVLVRLLPELSERGITELMEERGVHFAP